jgi:hypothetical protein
MSKPNDGAERRADLLGRLQETGDRHDAAELQQEQQRQELQRKAAEESNLSEVQLLRRAIEELRAVAAETRQLNAEMRASFQGLIAELRRPGRGY